MGPEAARRLAGSYLAEALPRRWRHVQGVASRAEVLSGHIEEGALLVVAAWLHDVGYAPDLAVHQFHPLDGARALRELGGDPRLCNLVAFHSAAAYEASALGLGDELQSEFSDESSLTRDLVWYLDMTTNPDGATVTFDDRMAEVRDRYPVNHYVIRALEKGMIDRRSAVDRAQAWLADMGLSTQV